MYIFLHLLTLNISYHNSYKIMAVEEKVRYHRRINHIEN